MRRWEQEHPLPVASLAGGLCPFPPALSLREREHPRQRIAKAGASDMFERRSACLPLTRGEGRGEGERDVRLTGAADITNPLPGLIPPRRGLPLSQHTTSRS